MAWFLTGVCQALETHQGLSSHASKQAQDCSSPHKWPMLPQSLSPQSPFPFSTPAKIWSVPSFSRTKLIASSTFPLHHYFRASVFVCLLLQDLSPVLSSPSLWEEQEPRDWHIFTSHHRVWALSLNFLMVKSSAKKVQHWPRRWEENFKPEAETHPSARCSE